MRQMLVSEIVPRLRAALAAERKLDSSEGMRGEIEKSRMRTSQKRQWESRDSFGLVWLKSSTFVICPERSIFL